MTAVNGLKDLFDKFEALLAIARPCGLSMPTCQPI
jgi:hypothetical protein